MSGALLRLPLSQPLVWEEEELGCGGETREDGDQELLLPHARGLRKDRRQMRGQLLEGTTRSLEG